MAGRGGWGDGGGWEGEEKKNSGNFIPDVACCRAWSVTEEELVR